MAQMRCSVFNFGLHMKLERGMMIVRDSRRKEKEN